MLVTGATGFLGRHFVQRLLERGHPASRLRCLVRDPGRATAAGLPASTLSIADLADPASEPALAAAAAGVDLVVHLAAELRGWSRWAFAGVNVGGTDRLLRAVAAAAPSAHVVLASSLAAAGPSADGVGSAAPPAACRPVSAYGVSKLEAELRLVAGRQPWTIVRPPVVYGAGDGATQMLFRQACAALAPVPWRPRPLSVIHVDDVVRALVRVLEVRPPGAVLPLDGCERTDTHAFVRAIAAACGRRARLVRVPIAVAALGAVVADGWAAWRGRASYFSRDKVREIRAVGWVADARPARSVLGFAASVPLHQGLADVARREGWRPAVTSATA
ncbi:MAG: NAD(P)-dependent oxidoreductase [Planctomycetes bacterium]|nr:NAD(P)-dependent oxidoreductase [Planctomycetota bacterium]